MFDFDSNGDGGRGDGGKGTLVMLIIMGLGFVGGLLMYALGSVL